MREEGLSEWLARRVAGAAHHEAGHATAAVLQAMPLQAGGVHVDLEGSGVTHYWNRAPGDLAMSEEDQRERERTVVSLYAGDVAQRRFLFPDVPDDVVFQRDMEKIAALLNEMCFSNSSEREAHAQALRGRAEELVLGNWEIVDRVASALLAKTVTPMSEDEIANGWSQATRRAERWMSGAELADIFRGFHLHATIRLYCEIEREPE